MSVSNYYTELCRWRLSFGYVFFWKPNFILSFFSGANLYGDLRAVSTGDLPFLNSIQKRKIKKQLSDYKIYVKYAIPLLQKPLNTSIMQLDGLMSFYIPIISRKQLKLKCFRNTSLLRDCQEHENSFLVCVEIVWTSIDTVTTHWRHCELDLEWSRCWGRMDNCPTPNRGFWSLVM